MRPLVLAFAVLLACHQAVRRETPCLGDRVAVRVHNASSTAVEVLIHIGDDPHGRRIGVAPVGGAQLGIPRTSQAMRVWFEAQRSNGSTVAPAFGNQRDYSRITYDLVCEDSAT